MAEAAGDGPAVSETVPLYNLPRVITFSAWRYHNGQFFFLLILESN
jgi:hypothetical protein